MSQPTIPQITAPALAEALKGDRPPVLLDVREPWELETARIPGAIAIPLGQLTSGFASLDPTVDLVVMCHHGGRSMHAAMFLAQKGFGRVSNLSGGIEAWSLNVDSSVARY